ncbi:hypothetical protein JCM10212_005059 [Sporobolomyces blumeae]
MSLPSPPSAPLLLSSYRFPPVDALALPAGEAMDVEAGHPSSQLDLWSTDLFAPSSWNRTSADDQTRNGFELALPESGPSSMRKNSLGLDMDSLAASPPLVPFAFGRPDDVEPSATMSLSDSCPPSPPLVALSLPPMSSNQTSPSSTLPPPFPPQRPVAHPLHSMLRLEMTPLPFELPLPDVEASPTLPWTVCAAPSSPTEASLGSSASPLPKQGRKNSLVPLPLPPTPPLTPSEELPAFSWGTKSSVAPVEELHRGRSTKVTPLAKRRRVL